MPIVLIQGRFQVWQHISSVGDFISKEGYPVYVVERLGNNLIDIPKAAMAVRQQIEDSDLHNVIIVAHSKGCLVGKYLLVHQNKDKRVLGMVALAGPFSGTELANLLPWKTMTELQTNSQVVADLDLYKEVNKRIISIYPKQDDLIWTEKGSFLEGALDNVMLPDLGHHSLLFSEDSKEVILSSIEKLSNLPL